MPYEKVAREDLTDGVARQLRAAILTGAHVAGDLLPPERDLAARFGVDRHTLRSALTELEQQGLVQRKQGSGCRVLDFRETGTLELIRYLVVTPGTDELDLAMVGPVLETAKVALQGLADLVVARAQADDIAAMRDALDALATTVADGDAIAIADADRRYVRMVFRGARSLAAELLANTFEQIFDAAIDPEGRVRLHWEDDILRSGRLDTYAAVIDAVETRDTETARRLVGQIVETIPGAVATAADAPAKPARRSRRNAG